MKDSEVYLRAARVAVEEPFRNGIGTCLPDLIAVQASTRQERTCMVTFDWGLFGNNKQRSIALCFMASIAASEGK